ncbi:MAG: hypothetical protein KY475_07615 [Planctomycetes bacterium]|nr:hypothetical protein [Planctomycetota bacterium]
MIRKIALAGAVVLLLFPASSAFAELRVGAAVVDVTPPQFPVLVNGGMLTRSASQVKTPVNARAIVLDDGAERLAIVVVDSCMMPRPLLDDAKAAAAARTKIRPDHILISATHTHTAPSCMGALGTNADPTYIPYLREKLAESIAAAEKNLEPAKVGWGVTDAGEYTALRRWVRRPDRIDEDPFGNPTVRANMHAARNWDDVTGESGPEDPDLSLIAFQSPDGRPLAVLANFSMHYFGDQALSADYFGLFAEGLKQRLAANTPEGKAPFVGVMSHGCSGDIWRRDYRKPPEERDEDKKIDTYAEELVNLALDAYQDIEWREDADLAMAEARMELRYRTPDKQRLEWAQRIVEAMGDRPPKDTTEVYAREQVILHELQSTEVVQQAVRIGDIGIATTPNETYALTGLKIKLQSPLPQTMVIELANGGDGYIPPPEQHLLGGYNTWAARSAGLEVQAEPKMTETALQLLEKVAGRDRRAWKQTRGPAAESILNADPAAYWRLDEFAGPRAMDSSGNNRDGIYEPGVVFFLEGPQSDQFCETGEVNRAAHFAGGRLATRVSDLGDQYTISLWIWNGMPTDGRDVTGWIFSRGRDHGLGTHGEHLGLGGTAAGQGKLIFFHGDHEAATKPAIGRTDIERWTWNNIIFVRDGDNVRVYLNGDLEIETKAPAAFPNPFDQIFFGGRSDNQNNWEGRLDEIAVFNRTLSPEEIAALAK